MAASASAAVGAGGPGPEAHVVGDGEVVVEAGGVAEQADPAAHARAGGRRREVVAEHRRPRPTTTGEQAGAGPQQRGLAGAVRPLQEHDLAAARRRGRRRRGRGSGRAGRPRRGGGRRAPWDRARVLARPCAGSRSAPAPLPWRVDRRLLARTLGGDRPHDDHRRRPDPAVRRLPAVGHRHPHGPGPGRPRGRVRRAARPRPTAPSSPTDDASTTHHDARPGGHHDEPRCRPTTAAAAAARAAARPAARPPATSPSTASASTGCFVEGVVGRQPQGRARATTRDAAARARRATPPSPGTAPPTARRSPTSTSCEPGDEIIVTTVQGEFTYVVRETDDRRARRRSRCSDPATGTSTATARPSRTSLTLTACHPKYSARERIIIGAELVGEPAPPTPRSGRRRPRRRPGRVRGANLSGDRAGAGPAILWGAAAAPASGWSPGPSARSGAGCKWPAYVVGIVPFMVCLFFFFENFSRLLPANY